VATRDKLPRRHTGRLGGRSSLPAIRQGEGAPLTPAMDGVGGQPSLPAGREGAGGGSYDRSHTPPGRAHHPPHPGPHPGSHAHAISLPNIKPSNPTLYQLPMKYTPKKKKKTALEKIEDNSLTEPEWAIHFSDMQIRFLEALAMGGSISKACRACRISRTNPYRWADQDPQFAEAMVGAREIGVQQLEDWALARATDEMNPSDRLTEFLLKALRPEMYRERVDHHHHGSVEHKKRIIIESPVTELTDEPS